MTQHEQKTPANEDKNMSDNTRTDQQRYDFGQLGQGSDTDVAPIITDWASI